MDGQRTTSSFSLNALSCEHVPVPAPIDLIGRKGRSDASWFMVGDVPKSCVQGWKIYIPATARNYLSVLNAVAPVLSSLGVAFKYLRSIRNLIEVNAGHRGFSQIGKCIVGYVHDDQIVSPLLASLREIISSMNHEVPFVPRLPRAWAGANLFYRYGSYSRGALVIGGVEIEDDRTRPWQALSMVGRNPFLEGRAAATLKGIARADCDDEASMLRRYPVFKTICRSGKGGVFVAIDLTKSIYAEVVVKIGLRGGQFSSDGRDGAHFVRHEHEMYMALSRTKAQPSTPSVVAYAEEPVANVLVMSFVEGENLAEWRKHGGADLRVLDEALETIQGIHDAGFYIGDAKVSNFIKTDRGLTLVDLESMGHLSAEHEDSPPCTFIIQGVPPLSRKTFDILHFLISAVYRGDEVSRLGRDSQVVNIHEFVPSIDVRDQWDEAAVALLTKVMLSISSGVGAAFYVRS